MKIKTIHGTNRGAFILMLFMLPFFGMTQNVKLEKYTFGDGLRFTGDKGYNIIMRGFVQPYYELKSYTDSENPGNFQRFRMRRLRLRMDGDAAEKKVTWRLQVDLSGSPAEGEGDANGLLLDAWIGYRVNKQIRLRLGQKNTPTDNRELQIRSHTLQLVERSRVTSAFSTIREFGLFIDGNFNLGNGNYVRPALAITNGDGLNVYDADFGGLKFGGRLDYLPFGTFTNMGQYHEVDMMRELTPKLVFGVVFSYNQGMSSRRGRESGSILYLDADDNYALPDFIKYGADFIFKYKGFSAVGEFVMTDARVTSDITQRVRNDGSVATTFPVDDGNGGTVQDVNRYVRGRMMMGAGYNIQMGYLFKNRISIDARYTHIDAADDSFLNNGTFYNRPNYYTFGLTKFFSKMYGFKVQTSITYVDCEEGSNNIYGEPMNGDEWIFRVITSIAF